jgi:hypothetical protein
MRDSILDDAAVVSAVYGKWEVKEVPTSNLVTSRILIKIPSTYRN